MPDIDITTDKGEQFGAYLTLPDGDGKAPVVVMIQEIFGVNAEMRRKCDEMAEKGYIAVCPDLFWRIKPGIQLTDKTDAEWEQAFDLFGKFDPDKGAEDIQATIDELRGHDRSNGKVGAVGYCLGGQLAYMTATRTDADCSVGYYGVRINEMLDEAGNIKKPLMLHIAGKDEFVPPEAQNAIIDVLAGHPLATTHHYPENDHAFARFGGAHYDEESANLANSRTAAFLEQHLQ